MHTKPLGAMLRDVKRANMDNFRVFGPDESTSNKLDAVYRVSKKLWSADYRPEDADGGELSPDGRVLEMLSEHTHGLSDRDFDSLFTVDGPIIFNLNGYRWLIHRLSYRRTNRKNLHVRGDKERGNINTPLVPCFTLFC